MTMEKHNYIKISSQYKPPRVSYGLPLLQDLDFYALSSDHKVLLFALYAVVAKYDNEAPINLKVIQSLAGQHVTYNDVISLKEQGFIAIHDNKIQLPEPPTKALRPLTETPELSVVAPPVYPNWLDLNAWNEFLQHRRDIHKPASALAITKLLKVLESNQGDQAQIIDNSIQNRWTGLFPLKGGKANDDVWKSTYDNAFRPDE